MAVLFLAACSADVAESLVIVRDSAGVQIVENHASLDDVAAWRLSDVPTLHVGALDGDPSYQLFRVYGALRLDDGGVVIANSGTSELRFYDERAQHVRSVGRDGEGPGEFRGLMGVWRYRADSLIAWDARLHRVTVLDLAGNVGRVTTLQPAGYNPQLVTPFSDGRMLIADAVFDIPDDGLHQQYANLLRFDAAGSSHDSIGRIPTFSTLPVDLGDGRTMISQPVFGPRGVVTGGPGGFVTGTARTAEVAWHELSGAVVRLVAWTAGDRSVSSSDIERYRSERLATAGDANDRRREQLILDHLPVAEQLPAYEDLRISLDGNLWVRQFDRPGYTGPARWLVFDSSGRSIARAETLPSLRVLEIGSDYVLGVFRDELDVEHVRVRALIKG